MRLATILIVCCSLVQTASYAQFGLGKLKKALDTAQKVSEMSISEEDEIALGEAVSANIRSHFGVVQDPAATRYVTLVGLVLARESSRPHLPYQFMILDSDTINAFAAPGGFIHVTRGALASFEDEAELAGVLGHEIAHVTEKHTLEGIKKARGLEIAEGETLRGNGLVMDQLAGKLTEGILAGVGRKEELESDAVGVRLAAGLGYEPYGLSRFLEVLKSVNEGSSSRSGLFASHPETDERLKKLANQIEKEGLAESASLRLPERLQKNVQYEFVESAAEEAAVAGARGVASSGKKEKDEPKKKKRGGFLGKLSNPLGSGEKEQRAEVTGTGAGRGVGAEAKEKAGGAKNPNPVKVEVTAAELAAFKQAGNLG